MRGAALTLALVSAASCTLLGTREVVQCDVDADCPDIRPVCAAHLCSARASVDAGSDLDAPPLPTCSTTEPCKQVEGKFLCIDGQCQHVDTNECPIILPGDETYRQDGVTLVGVYMADPGSSAAKNAVEIALDEIDHSIHPPLVAAILCKKMAPVGADSARKVVDHLATLHVPLVIGDFETSELTSLAQMPELRHVAVWSTLGNDKTVHPLGDSFANRAFLVDELPQLVPAFQPVVDQAIARAEELNGGPIAEPQVALVGATMKAEVRGVVEKLQTSLNVRGKVGGLTLYQIQSAFEPQQASELFVDGQTVAAKAPHVVIAVGGSEIVNDFMQDFEAHAGLVRPVWVLSSRAKFDLGGLSVPQTLHAENKLFARVLGVDFSGDVDAHDAYVGELRSHQAPALVASYDALYDAMYVVTLASKLAARGRGGDAGPLTDQDFMRGLAMLSDADADGGADAGVTMVGIGQTDLVIGEAEIDRGNPVSFHGSTGPWMWDSKIHSRRMGSSMFCMKPNATEFHYYLDLTAPLSGNCQAP